MNLKKNIKKLGYRHKLFIENYEGIGTGEKAALAAGYKASRARVTACELLQDPGIQEELRKKAARKYRDDVAVTDEVLARLSEIIRDKSAKNIAVVQAADKLLKAFGVYSQTINNNHVLPENTKEAIEKAKEIL